MDQEREEELERAARAYFNDSSPAPISGRDLADRCGVTAKERPAFDTILGSLEEAGLAVEVEGRGWCSPRREGWLIGSLTVHRRGFGFVRPAIDDGQGDLFIPSTKLKDGHHGDLVLVKPRAKPRRGAPPARGGGDKPGREARVLLVIKRSPRILLGEFWKGPRGGGVVEPLRHESVREIDIEPGRDRGAKDGQRVLVRLRDVPPVEGLPAGEIVEIALPEGTWKADLQLVCAEFGLRQEFEPEVLAAAERLSATDDDPKRTDLRDVPFITIDPSDAKDHDDAITLEDHGNEGFLLGVAIADVSHFVRANDPIDKEAYERGTSTYLPGLTIPMLPERLSNDLCSLRPDVDRLAKVVWISFERDGTVRDARVERAVMRNHRKFAYSEAQDLIDGVPPDEDERPYVDMILALDRLRASLYEQRRARGCLDLELGEMRLRLDDEGEVIDLESRTRDKSHHLVEECMLAANEAVARIATERSIAILRRTHEEPPEEDLTKFLKLCRVLVPGVSVRGLDDLPQLPAQLVDEPASPIVQLALLRALTRAEYTATRGLHFALATDEYCHFTSPIRRYPDLQVHRALDDALFGDRRVASEEVEARLAALGAQGEHCSERERNAEDAEREMSKMRAISFLRHRVGERFTGVIAAVRDQGFFVRLDEFLTEGFVAIRTLRDDYYTHDEARFALRGRNTGHQFRLGDPIEVRLTGADPLHRTIDLGYLQHLHPHGESEAPSARSGPPSSPRGKSRRGSSRRGSSGRGGSSRRRR